jgi:hypothetical protein
MVLVLLLLLAEVLSKKLSPLSVATTTVSVERFHEAAHFEGSAMAEVSVGRRRDDVVPSSASTTWCSTELN